MSAEAVNDVSDKTEEQSCEEIGQSEATDELTDGNIEDTIQGNMSRSARKTVFGVSDQVLHKPTYTSQKQARSLKFWIYEEEEFYYLCSENKGADQLRSCSEADLRHSFRIGKNLVFSRFGSYHHGIATAIMLTD